MLEVVNVNDMKERLKLARESAITMMSEKIGFPVEFNARVKELDENDGRMSFYKAGSQFKRDPLIYVNSCITSLMVKREIPVTMLDNVLEDCLMNEYARVIVEYGMKHDADMRSMIPGSFKNDDDFYAGFVDYIRDDENASKYEPIVKRYGKLLENLYSFDSSCLIGLS